MLVLIKKYCVAEESVDVNESAFPPRRALSWRLVVCEMNLRPTLLLPALVVFDLDFTLVRG